MTFCLILYYNQAEKISLGLGYSMSGAQYQYLAQCRCYRSLSQDSLTHSANISLSNTTCSEEAYYKGSRQKVISFTYFEPSQSEGEAVPSNKTNRDYFLGIRENLRLVKTFYPGYNMRLYYQVFTERIRTELCHLGNYCSACHLAKLTSHRRLFYFTHGRRLLHTSYGRGGRQRMLLLL